MQWYNAMECKWKDNLPLECLRKLILTSRVRAFLENLSKISERFKWKWQDPSLGVDICVDHVLFEGRSF